MQQHLTHLLAAAALMSAMAGCKVQPSPTPADAPKGSAKAVPIPDDRANGDGEMIDVEAIRRREITDMALEIPGQPFCSLDSELYRKTIHERYVVEYCAKCHHANASFVLQAEADEQGAFGNFVRLNKTSIAEWQMIDRDFTDKSLLLQFGLPQWLADRPHPQVAGWAPYFSGTKDARYLATKKWIVGLRRPAPRFE